MASKTPIRGDFSGSDLVGLAEFQASDFIAIADGGTGAVTASGARTALGLAIGSDIQAFDAQLTDISGLTPTDAHFIVGDGSNFVTETGSTARASLGLGSSDSPTFTNLTISGNLTVSGTQTILSTETLTVDDNQIVLNSNATGSATENAGIEIERGDDTNVTLLWDETNNRWTVGSESFVASTFIGNLTGNVTGTVSSLSNQDTDSLSEGSSNLYFTDTRADGRIAAASIGDLSDVTLSSTTTGDILRYNGSAFVNEPLNLGTDTEGNYVADITAGAGLATTGSASEGQSPTLSVNVDDSSIEIDTDTLQVKALGITDAMLAGSISNSKLTNNTITVTDGANSTATALGGTITFTGGAGVDIAESSGTLTFTADLGEITTDLNERIDDRIGSGMVVGGDGVDVAYDDSANTFTLSADLSEITEAFTDKVGTMFSGGTETLITVTYDDTNNRFNLVVDNDLANYSNTNTAFITLGSISVTDSGGDGSLSYDNSNGVITYTGPSAAETRAHFSAGTGITLSSGEISIPQVITTSSDVVFNQVTADLVGNVTGNVTGTVSSLSNQDTDNLTEGSSNLYFTNARARGSVSVTDSGGDGSLAYNSTTGVITYTGPSAAEVQAHITAGTGVSISSGEVAIGQAVATTSDVNFATVTTTGNVTVGGNLTVSGTQTIINTETLTVDDNIIILNSNAASTPTENAGIEVERGDSSNKTFLWNETDDKWTIGSETFVAGTFEGALTGNVTGTVSSIANHSTSDLSEGTNLYYTDARAQASITGGTGISNTSGTLAIDFTEFDTDNMVEGSTNQYHTAARARASVSGSTGITYNSSTGAISIDGTVATLAGSQTLTNKTINLEDSNDVISVIMVTVDNASGSNKYLLDGEVAGNIQITPGVTYRFDMSDSSNSSHPFRFSTVYDGTHTSGSQYTTGVTTSGTAGSTGAYVDIKADASTPDRLFYYCGNHSGMGGGLLEVAGNSMVTFAVTVANVSGNKYHLDGETAASVQLVPGTVYRFDQGDSSNSGHPLVFSTTKDGTHNSGSQYTTQVSTSGTPGTAGSYTQIIVNAATADSLYYYCTNHSGMGGDGVISVQGLSLADSDTDDLSEGSSNLYFTNARARSAVSATDAGGDGSFAYNSSTGVFTYTGPSASETRAHFSGSTGITLTNGAIAIDGTVLTSSNTTDDVTEGSSNLYHTTARARSAISVTDAGGDGSLAYNSSTGVITYTGPSAAEVRAHITAGTGVSIASGEVAIGQSVGTSDNVTFNDMTVAGNLTVSGTTTTINTETLTVDDNIIVLNNNATGTPSENAGIEIERGSSTNVTFLFDESADKWTIGSETFVAGTVEANLTGNVTGDVTGNADTATALATARTIGGVSFNGTASIDLPGVNTAGNQNTSGSAATLTTARNFSLTGDVTASAVSFDGSGAVALATTIGAGAVDFAMIADTVDEDDMTSNSATKLPTQQSVKAYVDAQVATKDALSELSGDTDDITEGSTNLFHTSARADARIALANLQDLANVGFSAPGSAENQKVISWDNSAGAFALSSVSGLSGSGETNTASNIGTAGVGLFDAKVGEDLQFKKLNAGSAKITITDDSSNNEVDIDFGAVSIDDLSDVDVTTAAPTSGQALKWDGSNFVPGDASSNIAQLGDVTLSSLSANQVLRYSGSAWLNVTLDTDDIGEGSTNQYHTTERVQDVTGAQLVTNGSHTNITAAYDDSGDGAIDLSIADTTITGKISVTDSGGDGSLAYNNSTGVITYTGPSASEVQAHITAGTGVTISSGEVAIGQAVATTSDVTFNDLVVSGNLTVSGTQTTVNTETIALADNQIVLNSNATGSASENGGIEIERGDDANKTLIWNESIDKWTVGSETFVAGTFEGSATAITSAAITGLTEDTSPAETDLIVVYDGSAGALKKVAKSNFAGSVTFSVNDEMPLTLADASSDPIQFSNVGTSGTDLDVVLADGTTDPINITGTSNSSTVFRDGDTDTFVAVETSNSDDDKIRMNTAGSERLTIEADGVVDIKSAKLKINSGAGTNGQVLSTDGAGTISWVDNGGSVAINDVTDVDTTGLATGDSLVYDGSNFVPQRNVILEDADGDTKIQVEEATDEDTIRFDTGGTERMTITGTTIDVKGNNLKNYSETNVAVTQSTGTVAIDLSSGNTGEITLSASVTDIDFTNVPTSGTSTFTMKVTQDGTGSRTMAINAITVNGGGNVTGKTVEGDGLTLSTGANDEDIVTFLFFNAGTPFINALLDFS